jgi:hypothetical protein
MAGDGGDDVPYPGAPPAARLHILREREARFGKLVDDLDTLGLTLAAARTEHALDAFRREAERLTPG